LGAEPPGEAGMTEPAFPQTNGLRSVIEQAGGALKEHTVLSPQIDSYRIDTPANHLVGRWLLF
jgi:hypothetical protein